MVVFAALAVFHVAIVIDVAYKVNIVHYVITATDNMNGQDSMSSSAQSEDVADSESPSAPAILLGSCTISSTLPPANSVRRLVQVWRSNHNWRSIVYFVFIFVYPVMDLLLQGGLDPDDVDNMDDPNSTIYQDATCGKVSRWAHDAGTWSWIYVFYTKIFMFAIRLYVFLVTCCMHHGTVTTATTASCVHVV